VLSFVQHSTQYLASFANSFQSGTFLRVATIKHELACMLACEETPFDTYCQKTITVSHIPRFFEETLP